MAPFGIKNVHSVIIADCLLLSTYVTIIYSVVLSKIKGLESPLCLSMILQTSTRGPIQIFTFNLGNFNFPYSTYGLGSSSKSEC